MAARVFWTFSVGKTILLPTCLFLLKNYYIYLQNVNNQQIIGTPHARASAFAVYLSGTTIWNLLASWGKASASVSSIIPGNGVHGPLGPFWYGSLSDIIPPNQNFVPSAHSKPCWPIKSKGIFWKHSSVKFCPSGQSLYWYPPPWFAVNDHVTCTCSPAFHVVVFPFKD